MIKVFFIEPTDQAQAFLRRYHKVEARCEASGLGYHNAKTPIERIPASDASISFASAHEARQWASNCTMPDDKNHKCWVRHGRPEDGTLHVDKNGHTCAAGAGSIVAGNYHGFLHNGHLTPC